VKSEEFVEARVMWSGEPWFDDMEGKVAPRRRLYLFRDLDEVDPAAVEVNLPTSAGSFLAGGSAEGGSGYLH